MSQYSPSIEAERTLTQILIPGILKGISGRGLKGGIVTYTYVSVSEGVYDLRDVWNVHCDVTVTKQEENVVTDTKHYKGVWLASIPKLDADGFVVIDRKYYHTVMRQRTMPNVPITYKKKINGNTMVMCRMRCENYETLESSSLNMFRQTKKSRSVMIATSVEESKPVDVISYVRNHINSANWVNVFRSTLHLLQCSTTVITLIELLIGQVGEYQNQGYFMPSTLASEGGQYYVSILEHDVSTEYVLVCNMLAKFISVECGETDADDMDDYSNKIVDDYSNIMGKLLRKTTMRLGVKLIDNNRTNSPIIYRELIDAFTYNKWEVIDDYDSKLQISRIIEHTSPNCMAVALQEIIILSGSYSSYGSNDTYGPRMLHPSQHGFVCLVRTSDDVSAGMKLYLASDCRVSHNLYTFGKSFDDDNIAMRSMMFESLELPNDVKKLWTHNSHIVGIIGHMQAEILLENIKMLNNTFSYRIGNMVESNDYYGRLTTKVVLQQGITMYVDTTEMNRVRDRIVVAPNNFNSLCHEIPYIDMMPVARTMLSTKIMQKCITAHLPSNKSVDYSQLLYSQKPLVKTTKSTSYCYGYNAVVLYANYTGKGIEDGIVVNKASMDRGLFMIIKKVSLEWQKSNKWTVTEYMINVKVNSYVKEGTVLATVTYYGDNGITTTSKIKHDKPYTSRVADIELTFDTRDSRSKGMVAPKFLSSICITLCRCKRFRTADKLSSRSAQKAVSVTMVNEQDMPVVIEEYTPVGMFRGMPQTVDIIINPLSVISRCTVSQDLCSRLGIAASHLGCEYANEQFSHTEVTYSTIPGLSGVCDVTTLGSTSVSIMSGETGEVYDTPASIGIEYYMVLNHIADIKARSKGNMVRDDITGGTMKATSDTQVRYNWQELAAMIHAKAYKLASDIYNNTGDLSNYPYCNNCERDVDTTHDLMCEYCGQVVNTKVTVSRPFMASKRVAQVLGCDIIVKSD